MKQLLRKIKEAFYMLLGCTGLILCMCETADLKKQVFVFLAGMALMIIAALLIYLMEDSETSEKASALR